MLKGSSKDREFYEEYRNTQIITSYLVVTRKVEIEKQLMDPSTQCKIVFDLSTFEELRP